MKRSSQSSDIKKYDVIAAGCGADARDLIEKSANSKGGILYESKRFPI